MSAKVTPTLTSSVAATAQESPPSPAQSPLQSASSHPSAGTAVNVTVVPCVVVSPLRIETPALSAKSVPLTGGSNVTVLSASQAVPSPE